MRVFSGFPLNTMIFLTEMGEGGLVHPSGVEPETF
jgi:hypothetical protein